jgi:hypothetical protein
LAKSYRSIFQRNIWITPGRFGLIHGNIGTFHQFVTAFLMRLKQGNADTGAAIMLITGNQIGVTQIHQNFFPDAFTLRRRDLFHMA